MSWDINTAAATRPDYIQVAVWSPCSKLIAVTWDQATTVDVLDSITLQLLQALSFPQNILAGRGALIFSPDSHILTYSNCDSMGHEVFVISWDLQTGGVTSTIRHQGPMMYFFGFPSITCSTNGKMVGVLYHWFMGDAFFPEILVFDITSGIHVYSHLFGSDCKLWSDIWIEGESLWFKTTTQMESGHMEAFTIWKVRFASGATPTEVRTVSFPACNEKSMKYHVLASTPCRLALACDDEIVVWDHQNSRPLLYSTGDNYISREGSFSSDGHFFACLTAGSNINLWKETPTGYVLYKIYVSRTTDSKLLLSPNGESIITFFGSHTIQLWHVKGSVTTPSSDLAQTPQHTRDFILEFPHDGLAVVARHGCNVLTVLNLKSGSPQSTIDLGTEIYGHRMIGDTIIVVGNWKVITWNPSTGTCVPDGVVGLEGKPWTEANDHRSWPSLDEITGVSISPNSYHIAISTRGLQMHIYSTSTGVRLARSLTVGSIPWFSPGGDIWCIGYTGKAHIRTSDGWWNNRYEISWYARNSRKEDIKDTTNNEHPESDGEESFGTEEPPEGFPWVSSCGYQVTNDWWILGPGSKRLLMLPPPWQSSIVQQVWKGQFLALLHGRLPEPVILDLNPQL